MNKEPIKPVGVMTPVQAADRWCPLVRQPISANSRDSVIVAGNTNINGDRDAGVYVPHCVGPACALWRPIEEPVRRHIACDNPNALAEGIRPSNVPASWAFCPSEDDAACWVEPEAEAAQRVRGFCGAGGPPFWA